MTSVDSRFPAGIHALWKALHYEVVWLHGRWIIYRQLYGTSPEQIDVLNRAAGTFFSIVEEVLLQNVQISLSKLDDPAETRVRNQTFKNLTLQALKNQLEADGESAVVAKLNPLITKFHESCELIRTRRNKWITHFDQDMMLNQERMNPSRDEVEVALLNLRAAMNCVEAHFTGEESPYEKFHMYADGSVLLDVLSKGLRYEELVANGVLASTA